MTYRVIYSGLLLIAINSRAAQNPLDQLKDIHLPAPILTWPWAPGWWLLLSLALLAIAAAVVFLLRYLDKNRYRGVALNQLKIIDRKLMQETHLCTATLAELSQLLRRCALHHYGNQEVASLSGDEWLQFLESKVPDLGFSGATALLLTDAVYQHPNNLQASEQEIPALINMSRQWIRAHK